MRKLTSQALVLSALFLAAMGCGGGEEESSCGPTRGEIVGISDGDTLKVEADDGETYTIRLLLVDTPETNVDPGESPDCYGAEAKAFTSGFKYREVKLSYEPGDECLDRYGRLLAYVTPVGAQESLNEQLVAGGYARICRIDCDESRYDEFVELEDSAINDALGVWNEETCPGAADLDTWGASGCNQSCR